MNNIRSGAEPHLPAVYVEYEHLKFIDRKVSKSGHKVKMVLVTRCHNSSNQLSCKKSHYHAFFKPCYPDGKPDPKYSASSAQVESVASALYELFMGAAMAKIIPVIDANKNVVGTVSYALPHFKEIGKCPFLETNAIANIEVALMLLLNKIAKEDDGHPGNYGIAEFPKIVAEKLHGISCDALFAHEMDGSGSEANSLSSDSVSNSNETPPLPAGFIAQYDALNHNGIDGSRFSSSPPISNQPSPDQLALGVAFSEDSHCSTHSSTDSCRSCASSPEGLPGCRDESQAESPANHTSSSPDPLASSRPVVLKSQLSEEHLLSDFENETDKDGFLDYLPNYASGTVEGFVFLIGAIDKDMSLMAEEMQAKRGSRLFGANLEEDFDLDHEDLDNFPCCKKEATHAPTLAIPRNWNLFKSNRHAKVFRSLKQHAGFRSKMMDAMLRLILLEPEEILRVISSRIADRDVAKQSTMDLCKKRFVWFRELAVTYHDFQKFIAIKGKESFQRQKNWFNFYNQDYAYQGFVVDSVKLEANYGRIVRDCVVSFFNKKIADLGEKGKKDVLFSAIQSLKDEEVDFLNALKVFKNTLFVPTKKLGSADSRAQKVIDRFIEALSLSSQQIDEDLEMSFCAAFSARPSSSAPVEMVSIKGASAIAVLLLESLDQPCHRTSILDAATRANDQYKVSSWSIRPTRKPAFNKLIEDLKKNDSPSYELPSLLVRNFFKEGGWTPEGSSVAKVSANTLLMKELCAFITQQQLSLSGSFTCPQQDELPPLYEQIAKEMQPFTKADEIIKDRIAKELAKSIKEFINNYPDHFLLTVSKALTAYVSKSKERVGSFTSLIQFHNQDTANSFYHCLNFFKEKSGAWTPENDALRNPSANTLLMKELCVAALEFEKNPEKKHLLLKRQEFPKIYQRIFKQMADLSPQPTKPISIPAKSAKSSEQ